MEISSGKGHSISLLSTMAAHSFKIDDVKCASIESFIQSMKFDKPSLAASIAGDKSKSAKERGKKNFNWDKDGLIFWKGVGFNRESKQHQDFLDSVIYEVTKQCPEFAKALLETGDSELVCPGKTRVTESPVTEQEFCLSLTRARSRIRHAKS